MLCIQGLTFETACFGNYSSFSKQCLNVITCHTNIETLRNCHHSFTSSTYPPTLFMSAKFPLLFRRLLLETNAFAIPCKWGLALVEYTSRRNDVSSVNRSYARSISNSLRLRLNQLDPLGID